MADMPERRPPPTAALVEDLQAAGRYTFTLEQVVGLGERSGAATEAALRRLKQRGRIVSPRRGFFVVVPAEYRDAGAPPASWFVDDLMRFLGQPYYVGLLSAAAIHGAAHQQPMVFQIITDRPSRPAQAGRAMIEFHASRRAHSTPAVDVQTETGSMRVSSPEATAFDLVQYAAASGHLSNVATVLAELAETLDHDALGDVAASFPTPVVQRLGYLLDRLGESELAHAVARGLEGRRQRATLLVPGQGRDAEPPDPRWRVIPNEEVEVDL
jgi:predicted transcriptional regulator of viral defense system